MIISTFLYPLLSGKLFKSSDLPLVVEFFLMFYKDKPIDWLLDHLLFVKTCNPEKDTVSRLKIIILAIDLFWQNMGSQKNEGFRPTCSIAAESLCIRST
jgi:hypothetical protein